MSRKVTQAVRGVKINLNVPLPLHLSPKQLIQSYLGKTVFLARERDSFSLFCLLEVGGNRNLRCSKSSK